MLTYIQFVESTNNYFNLKSTGNSIVDDYINKKRTDGTVELKYMSLDTYLKMFGKVVKRTPDELLNKRKAAGSDDKVIEYANKMSKAGNFNTPYLLYGKSINNPTTFRQDGVHRMMAATKLGMKKIPVYVVIKNS